MISILFWIFLPYIPTYFLMRWSSFQEDRCDWFPIPNIGWGVLMVPYVNLLASIIVSIEIFNKKYHKENPDFHLDEYVFGRKK